MRFLVLEEWEVLLQDSSRHIQVESISYLLSLSKTSDLNAEIFVARHNRSRNAIVLESQRVHWVSRRVSLASRAWQNAAAPLRRAFVRNGNGRLQLLQSVGLTFPSAAAVRTSRECITAVGRLTATFAATLMQIDDISATCPPRIFVRQFCDVFAFLPLSNR